MTIEKAHKLRAILEQAAQSLDDATSSVASNFFPRLKEDGSLVAVGTKINWNGNVKRAAVDLWDTAENNPDNAPAVWEDIMYKGGIRIIPETITTGTVFAMDELGWWKDELYRSKLAANVYTPDQYAAGWEKV